MTKSCELSPHVSLISCIKCPLTLKNYGEKCLFLTWILDGWTCPSVSIVLAFQTCWSLQLSPIEMWVFGVNTVNLVLISLFTKNVSETCNVPFPRSQESYIQLHICLCNLWETSEKSKWQEMSLSKAVNHSSLIMRVSLKAARIRGCAKEIW